ncbi:hypothetical protein AB832_06590 [Flavobacteriaceae bacterium (ex Bugula neritina AB1)]|nr:hypothetical protein AB832_06590 [Flavobacteriaceae bacterium (ex Bugula neritina AB1)]
MRQLTDIGKSIIEDRYLLDGESYEDMLIRVTNAFFTDKNKRIKFLNYLKKHWFMPATPILSNGGTDKGLPISCFLNAMEDNLDSIIEKSSENKRISSIGGGIGTDISALRSIGEPIKHKGTTSGIIPFCVDLDASIRAISQGSLRRGSGAIYLNINHPEIEEFIKIRKHNGAVNRKVFAINHGININDDFLERVINDKNLDLISPATGKIIKKVPARKLWQDILDIRMDTGEPYIVNLDTINRALPEHHKVLGLNVRQSNLCSEITLPTGIDYNNKVRTAICCLGSINIEYYDEWKDDNEFIPLAMEFLDNVLSNFINKSKTIKGLDDARYSAEMERSIGLGAMGLHSYLLKLNIPYDSLKAQELNKIIFKNINQKVQDTNYTLAIEYGSCPDYNNAMLSSKGRLKEGARRFSYTQAIAPTANISYIAGSCSPSTEPLRANIFSSKTLTGTFIIKNKYLEILLEDLGKNTTSVWNSITENNGSVQHLSFLTGKQKDVFKTATEIDQIVLVKMNIDRTPYIDQAQSLNIFLEANVDKAMLNRVHLMGLRGGVKSYYYLRSVASVRTDIIKDNDLIKDCNDDICKVCQ